MISQKIQGEGGRDLRLSDVEEYGFDIEMNKKWKYG